MDGGNNTTNLLSENDNTRLQEFLRQFGLQDFSLQIVDSFQKIGRGELSKKGYLKTLVGKGVVTESNAGDVYLSIGNELLKLVEASVKEDEVQIAPPEIPVIEANGASDAPKEYVFEDKLFHQFLDYLKSLKISKEVEKRIFNLFISILKGLRDNLEAREVLSKKEIDGGCAMTDQKADEVFSNLQKFIKDMQDYGFTNDTVITWFRQHYDTLMTKGLQAGKIKDLQIDSHKEAQAGAHSLDVPRTSPEKTIDELLKNPNHDFNMPLDAHIKFHFDEIKSEPELPAVVKNMQVTTPPPLKNIPAKTTPDKIMPAPLPSREAVRPLESKTTAEMNSVARKPIMVAPVRSLASDVPPNSGDILPQPQRTVPAQLKQLVDADMAPQGGDLIMEAIAKGRKKPGFFSRVFNRKKVAPSLPASKISPSMPAATINAIPTVQGRPQVNDISFTPKLVTPVDELQSLTLQDFRRLSKDPLTAIKKISDKLELLSQESLRKKAEGIEALKKSALYSDYSAIMSESVMKGVSYNQVIQEKKTLTEGEYQALMQLNKLLRS